MKKTRNIYSCIFFCLLANMYLPTSANPIKRDSAQIKAEQIFRYNRKMVGKQLAMTNKKPKLTCVRENRSSEREDATYYIFNRQGMPGFAIIAGDDCMPALIGYSLENNIDVDNMPDALKLMLKNYDLYVKYLRENGNASVKSNVGPLEPGIPLVGPYIKTTWNQYTPYNWLTPVDNITGSHMPTGCVPTAAAQILNYYKWPRNSFYRIYNWNDMLDSYGISYGDAEGMAVATLMRDLGEIMKTTYQMDGSGTNANAYTRIPGYTCTNITDLKTGLSKGPLAICIGDVYNFVHAVIADGYDNNDLYHINWGWGGSCDGYYNLMDLTITYNNKEIHPFISPSYTFLLEPDYENESNLAVPEANKGVSVESTSAKVGDLIKVTLHNLTLLSGNDFDGYISLFIYETSLSKDQSGYYGNQVYGNIQYNNPKYTGFDYAIPWNSSLNGQDFDVSLTLPQLTSNGNYVLVPVCFNSLEKTDNSGVCGGNWRPLLKFADGTLAEDIPFEYQDGNYIFKEVPYGDFKIDVSQIVTASTYREKGNSSISAFIKNEGSNNFTGTMTVTLVNIDNASDVRQFDTDLYISANQSKRMILNTKFDYTGTFCIKELEVWKTIRSGDHLTFHKRNVDGMEMTILPKDNQEITTDFNACMNVEVLWKNNIPYVNDSIYKYEEANASFYAYSLDADTANVDVELWAVPVNDGLPSLLKKKNYPLSKKYIRTQKIGGSTACLSPGTYYLMAFGRCGNNTYLLSKPDTIGQGYKNIYDKIADNIIHVFDPGIDIPMLKLHSLKKINDLYHEDYGYAEAEIENISDVDYCGYTSSCLSTGSNSHMSVSSTPFRIKAKQTATIWPRLYHYKGTGEYSEGNFTYKVNNGMQDFTIPMEGDFSIKFTERPENKIGTSGIAFYYRDNSSTKPSLGFYSKGTLKRSLWKNDEIVMIFDDLQTDSTYNTYKVCPETSEIVGLPSGNYLLKINLTDIDGEHPTIVYPLVIDDKELPLTIEKVSFDTNSSFSYEGDIPVVVTIKNPTQQCVTTVVNTEIERKVDGKNSWWVDSNELHTVTLPAMQSTTINLNAHILSTSTNLRQDGTFKVYVKVCRTQRESGHLDFGPSKGSESIVLPYICDGISLNHDDNRPVPIVYYTLDGKSVKKPTRGFYIVKYSDGTVQKAYQY